MASLDDVATARRAVRGPAAGRARGRSWRWLPMTAMIALLALAGAAGCTDPAAGPTPGVSTSPSPSGYGVRYALPAGMCDAADLTALLELYPDEDLDSVLRNNSDVSCDTTLHAGAQVVGLAIEAIVTPESSMSRDPTLPEQWFEGQRRAATSTPVDIDEVGTDAFLYGDEHVVVLEAYDGNLNLRVRVSTVGRSHTLPTDMRDRVAAVAVGTMARLAA